MASLAVHASWSAVAAALEIATSGPTLPAVVWCPRCGQESLHVYQDTIKGHPWHQCKSCRTQGDLLQLLCACWDVGAEVALQMLSASTGQPTIVPTEKELATYNYGLSRGQRMLAFWEHARVRFLRNATLALPLRQRFRLRPSLEVDEERWLDGPGRVIGCATFQDADRVFHPDGTIGDGNSKYRIFKGGHWGEVLVFPFHRIADHLSAFLFVGRNGDPTDFAFKNEGSFEVHQHQEAGLLGLPCVMDSAVTFAVSDPLLLARMQIRNLRHSITPLPLVAWYQGPKALTKDCWSALAGRRVVFWVFELDIGTLAHAARTNAEIAVHGPAMVGQDGLDAFLKGGGAPHELLHEVLAQAVPWRIALTRWLRETEDGPVVELILGLERRGIDPHWIASELRADARDRLKRALLHRVEPEADFQWRCYVLRQTTAGTFCKRNGIWVQVANFSMFIDHDDGTRCAGFMLQNGRKLPFAVTPTRGEYRTRCNFEHQIIKAGGSPLVFHPHWLGRLIQLARERANAGSGVAQAASADLPSTPDTPNSANEQPGGLEEE